MAVDLTAIHLASTPQYDKFRNLLPKSRAPQLVPSGQNIIADIVNRRGTAKQGIANARSDTTQRLASDIVGKSAGTIPTDEFGLPQQQLTDFAPVVNQQLQATNEYGKTALATAQAKAQWQQADALNKQMAGYSVTDLPAGASADNPGAKAVAIAMQAYKNGTPYVWGGNSLKGGVDCSGLVQQAYKQLGIKVPRSTYEQAKSGKHVSLNQLLPGDLVFFNTGSRDPNGIGANGHVGIYIGNGKMVNAKGTKYGIRIEPISGATGAVRPW